MTTPTVRLDGVLDQVNQRHRELRARDRGADRLRALILDGDRVDVASLAAQRRLSSLHRRLDRAAEIGFHQRQLDGPGEDCNGCGGRFHVGGYPCDGMQTRVRGVAFLGIAALQREHGGP